MKKIRKTYKGHNVRIGVGGGVGEYLLPAILDSRNFLASSESIRCSVTLCITIKHELKAGKETKI